MSTTKKFIKAELTFLTPCFGTKPADPQIMREFLIDRKIGEIKNSKKLSDNEKEEIISNFGEAPSLDTVPEEEQKSLNLFAKDSDGHYILEGYMLKGIMKDALEARKTVKGSTFHGRSSKSSEKVFKDGNKEVAISMNIHVENIILNIDKEGIFTCNPDEMKLSPDDHVHVRSRPIRGEQPMTGKKFVSLKSAQTLPAGTKSFPFYIKFEERSDMDIKGMLEETLGDFIHNHGFGGRRSDGFGACWVDYKFIDAEEIYDPSTRSLFIVEKENGKEVSRRKWNSLT